MRRAILILVLSAAALVGCRQDNAVPPAEIAVSNSYLHAIVRDVCGDEMTVFSVVPPGMCPGHFDIKPSDVRRLFAARLLLAFDFQQSIGAILPEDGSGPQFHTIAAPAGMCIPDTYLSMVEQTADILIAVYPDREAFFRDRLEAIAERMTLLELECRAVMTAMGLNDNTVLVSDHQAAFAEWLGLQVAATFSGRDSETAAHINAALRQSRDRALRGVIANRQEGTQLAAALSDRLDVPVAVFSNFPPAIDEAAGSPAFDALVRSNLNQLNEAVQ